MFSFKEFFLEAIHRGKRRKSRFQSKSFANGTKQGLMRQRKKDGTYYNTSVKTKAEYKNDDVIIPVGPKTIKQSEDLYAKYAFNKSKNKPFRSFKIGNGINLSKTGYRLIKTATGGYVQKVLSKTKPKSKKSSNSKSFGMSELIKNNITI